MRTDEQKIRDAFIAAQSSDGSLLDLIKPKETESQAAEEDIASYSKAKREDDENVRRNRTRQGRELIEDEAGVDDEQEKVQSDDETDE